MTLEHHTPQAQYRVRTYDVNLKEFTVQEGVPEMVTGIRGLISAVRLLHELGYPCDRNADGSDPSVLIEKVETPPVYLMGYEWPASQLNSNHMRAFRAISKDVRIPITTLLRDAVEVYLTLLPKMVAQQIAEQSDSLSPKPDHEKL